MELMEFILGNLADIEGREESSKVLNLDL